MIKDLIFDVDGVLLDYLQAFNKFISNQNSKSLNSSNRCNEYSFLHSVEFSQMPPIISADEFNQLTAGKNVYLVTNLPSFCLAPREKNLKNLGFKYNILAKGGLEHYGEENYPSKAEVIVDLLGRDSPFVFVDDFEANCIDVAQNLINAKVFMLKGLHGEPKFSFSYKKCYNWQDLSANIKKISE